MNFTFPSFSYSSFILPPSSFLLLAAVILAGCGKAPPPAVKGVEAGRSGPSAQTPALQWPPHFSPPLEIHVAAPKVPAKILGPSPPIGEKNT